MVISFEWHQTAADQRRGLPMTGEETSLGALASPLAGYLGKVQERAASLERCPWCASKALNYVLQSYRINLQESVTLCSNPQCLFPLVSRPLEDVLADLVPAETTTENTRKHALEKEDLIPPKRLRSSELDRLGPQDVTDSQAGSCTASPAGSDQCPAERTDGGEVNGRVRSPAVHSVGWSSLPCDNAVPGRKSESPEATGGLASSAVSTGPLQSSSEESQENGPHHGTPGTSDASDACGPGDVSLEVPNKCGFTNENFFSVESNNTEQPSGAEQQSTGDETPTEDMDTECKDSSRGFPESADLVSGQDPLFWKNSDNLCWLDALLVVLVNCKSLKATKPKDKPLRSSVWWLMGEYDKACAAGQLHLPTGTDDVTAPNHTLEKADANLHSLRMSVFKLLQPQLKCKLGQRETPVFALPLLLKMDSWAEPLFQSTFHWEFQCSECKVFMKERVVTTLATFTNIVPDWRPLHAAHLAPCNVCGKGKQKRTMMLEGLPPVFALHFVKGLPDNDVSVYAFTFKGSQYSVTSVIQYDHHLKHFVTWLRKADGSWLEFDDLKHPRCHTHQKLPVPAQDLHVVFWEGERIKEPCSPTSTSAESPAPRPEVSGRPGERAAVEEEPSACSPDKSLLASHNDTDIVCALAADDSSVMDTSGTTTLLDAFEGLSHHDIITLTLVDLKGAPADEPPQDLCAPVNPDSSSVTSVREVCPGADATPAAVDHAPPQCQGRGTAKGQQTGQTTGAQGAAVPSDLPVQDAPPPVHTVRQRSPGTTPDLSASTSPPTPHQLQSTSTCVPDRTATTAFTQVKPVAPKHSTPHPVRRPPVAAVLRTEDGKGLPLRAAERYCAFGAKTPVSTCPPPSPALPHDPPHWPPGKGTGRPPEVTTPQQPRLSCSPQIVSDTDALRYKLLKKLKAKKKRLAKLNKLLSHQGGAGLLPDSTDLGSPTTTVTSSTYDASRCDDLLSDLLSPATTVGNLSPDSSGFLDNLTNRSDGLDHLDGRGAGACQPLQTSTENFFDDFLSQAVAQQPADIGIEDLELFLA